MKPVIVIGAGGHARVLIELMRLIRMPILGATDPAVTGEILGRVGYQATCHPDWAVPILGNDDVLAKHHPDHIQLVNAIGSTRSMTLRDAVYRRWHSRGFCFATLIHPAATVSPMAVLGEGVQVMAGAVIQCGAMIGANGIVNTRASVDHDCAIGESVHIAPGAILCGGVIVGDRTHVGAGAIMIQQANVGSDQLVRAGELYRSVREHDRSPHERGKVVRAIYG